MLWLLKLLLTIYFIPAKFVCAITILLLIVDSVFGKVIDPTTDPFIKTNGLPGVITIMVLSYIGWPYYLYGIFYKEKDQ